METCPRDVFVVAGGSLKLIQAEKCVFCDACVRTPLGGIDLPVSVTPDYTEMRLGVETVGSLTCTELV